MVFILYLILSKQNQLVLVESLKLSHIMDNIMDKDMDKDIIPTTPLSKGTDPSPFTDAPKVWALVAR